uniref:Uncharacterized protein n=1 Tax=Sarcophilus harrisii TaxID=9305 RepID=A0A7N4PPQ5_SARHA
LTSGASFGNLKFGPGTTLTIMP